MSVINHAETVARRKLGTLPEDVDFCRWGFIRGTDTTKLEVYRFRIATRGPRKGQRIFFGPPLGVAYVTEAEIEAEKVRFERETGKCHACGGDGREWAGWTADSGTIWRRCSSCKAMGKACLCPAAESAVVESARPVVGGPA